MFNGKLLSLGFVVGVLFTAVCLAGCSSNGPTAPEIAGVQTPVAQEATGTHGRYLWGEYLITMTDVEDGLGNVTGVDFSVAPLRTGEAHVNVTGFVTPPKCSTCVKIVPVGYVPCGSFSEITATVFLTNPTNLTGYDVRGIIYPPEGKVKLQFCAGYTTHDGLTTLYPEAGAPEANPYMAFNKPTLFRPFEGHAKYGTSYVLLKDNTYKVVNMVYKVDASYPSNALEPVDAYIFPLGPNDHIYPQGSNAIILASIADWQDNVSSVTLDMNSLGISTPQAMSKISQDPSKHTSLWQYLLTAGAGPPGGGDLRTIRLTALASDTTLAYMKDFQVAVTYDQDPPTWKVAGKEGIYDNVSGPAAMWLFFYEAYDVSQPLQYIFWGNDKSSPFDGSILKVVLSTDYVGYTPFSGYDNEKRWYGIRLQDGQGIQDNNQLEYIATRYSVNARWSILKGQLPPTYGILGGPVIGDVDGDGKKDIVVGARDSMIYAFGGSGTGTQDTSIWPSPYKAGGEIQGTPALVDLNGDGKLDVVFGADDMYVYAISGATGLELWKHDTKSSPTDSYLIHGSPSIAQLNGGAYDVLIGTGKGEMFALNGENGSEIWKFPTTGGIAGTPGVADISGDGIPDVCFGSYDTKVHLVNGATGEEIWFYYLGPGMDNIDSSPVMVDISGDNVPDVIIGGRKGTPPETGTVLALDGASPGPTANELWPAPHIYGNARLPLAPAKINDDDVWDFIMTTYQGEVYSIYAINGANGEILYHTLGLDIPPVGVFNYSAPIVGDFTGDGHLNAIYGREDGYCDMVNIGDLDLPGGFAGKCLAKMQVSSGTSMEIYGPPAVEDVNGDGLWELIACSMRGFTYVLDMHAPVPADIHQRGWTQHMGNRWHTGVPEFVPPDE